MSKILFVCSANAQRSPTAASLFSVCPDIETKSAGTNVSFKGTQINQTLVDWADVIFVMSEEDEGHTTFIKENFSLHGTPIHDLEIPDVYVAHDKELKSALIHKVARHLDLQPCLDRLPKNL